MPNLGHKTTASIVDNSKVIASWSNCHDSGSIHWHKSQVMYYPKSRKWFAIEYGGPAMHVDHTPDWLSRVEAVELIATKALDPITGYGYTIDQAEVMVYGSDAGPGYRD